MNQLNESPLEVGNTISIRKAVGFDELIFFGPTRRILAYHEIPQYGWTITNLETDEEGYTFVEFENNYRLEIVEDWPGQYDHLFKLEE